MEVPSPEAEQNREVMSTSREFKKNHSKVRQRTESIFGKKYKNRNSNTEKLFQVALVVT
jgi:hypothetical protein